MSHKKKLHPVKNKLTEIYSQVKRKSDELVLFDEMHVTLKVRACDSVEVYESNRNPYSQSETGNKDTEVFYVIDGISFDDSKCENKVVSTRVRKVIDELNHGITVGKSKKYYWNVFYVYKELFQKLVDQEGYSRSENDNHEVLFNYFRGQTVSYKMVPGIFRKNVKPEYVLTFDKIYRELCNDYSDALKYVEYSRKNRRIRAQQLALLQHYGLRTSLVDITKNPYIALEFMSYLKNCKDWGKQAASGLACGRFEMFAINEEEHSTHNIFLDVVKSVQNKRLIAQKGAFFCYDYLNDLTQKNISKIPRIIMDWKFDSRSGQNKIDDILDRIHENGVKDKQTAAAIRHVEDVLNGMRDDKAPSESEIYEEMFKDIDVKLSQYYYFRKNLFPDLDRYIEYVNNNYSISVQNNLVDETDNING